MYLVLTGVGGSERCLVSRQEDQRLRHRGTGLGVPWIWKLRSPDASSSGVGETTEFLAEVVGLAAISLAASRVSRKDRSDCETLRIGDVLPRISIANNESNRDFRFVDGALPRTLTVEQQNPANNILLSGNLNSVCAQAGRVYFRRFSSHASKIGTLLGSIVMKATPIPDCGRE